MLQEEFEIEVEATAAEVDFTQTGCLKQESTDNSNNKPGKSDDDLTSLSWLQDKNLLKGLYFFPLCFLFIIFTPTFTFYHNDNPIVQN